MDIPNLQDIVCVGVTILIHDEGLALHTCFYATEKLEESGNETSRDEGLKISTVLEPLN